jgi:hypothetical protein
MYYNLYLNTHTFMKINLSNLNNMTQDDIYKYFMGQTSDYPRQAESRPTQFAAKSSQNNKK